MAKQLSCKANCFGTNDTDITSAERRRRRRHAFSSLANCPRTMFTHTHCQSNYCSTYVMCTHVQMFSMNSRLVRHKVFTPHLGGRTTGGRLTAGIRCDTETARQFPVASKPDTHLSRTVPYCTCSVSEHASVVETSRRPTNIRGIRFMRSA